MSKKHVRMLDLAFQSFAVFLGLLGRNPRAHNLACACRVVHVCTRTSPKTRIFVLSVFPSAFACMLLFSLFSIFLCFQNFYFTCLIISLSLTC